MRMRTIIVLFAAIILVVGFQNCGGRGLTIKNGGIFRPSEGTSSGNPSSPDITFKVVSANIFQPYCVSCHNGDHSEVSYETYESTVARGNLSALNRHYLNYTTPNNGCTPLTLEQMDLVTQWIRLGAPQ